MVPNCCALCDAIRWWPWIASPLWLKGRPGAYAGRGESWGGPPGPLCSSVRSYPDHAVLFNMMSERPLLLACPRVIPHSEATPEQRSAHSPAHSTGEMPFLGSAWAARNQAFCLLLIYFKKLQNQVFLRAVPLSQV